MPLQNSTYDPKLTRLRELTSLTWINTECFCNYMLSFGFNLIVLWWRETRGESYA